MARKQTFIQNLTRFGMNADPSTLRNTIEVLQAIEQTRFPKAQTTKKKAKPVSMGVVEKTS